MHRCWFARECLLACLLTAAATAAVAQSTEPSATGQPLQEVTVSATRELDHKTLSRAVNTFVESHAAAGARINQIGRWHVFICPQITGLRPAFANFVTRQVLDVARGVGAPTPRPGAKCAANVEIVFTRQPQALVDHMAKSYRVMLGYFPKAQVAQALKFSRPIQAWYETGTKSSDYQPPAVSIFGGGTVAPQFNADASLPFHSGAQVDSDVTATGMQPTGMAGSLMGQAIHSEFMHVLIVADSARVSQYSLQTIADYVALLSLTRMSQLDNCAPLPSITDLLANGCNTPVADSLTAADRAYLKALYSADLEKNINLERGDVHERMMQQIEGK